MRKDDFVKNRKTLKKNVHQQRINKMKSAIQMRGSEREWAHLYTKHRKAFTIIS